MSIKFHDSPSTVSTNIYFALINEHDKLIALIKLYFHTKYLYEEAVKNNKKYETEYQKILLEKCEEAIKEKIK